MHESMPPVTVQEAINLLLKQVNIKKEITEVSTEEALNCVTAAEISSKRDIPRFDNSAMDGYLFLSDDLTSGKRKFPVTGEIRPEHEQPETVKPGTTMRIMTGAQVPAGKYTVVPVENIREYNSQIEVAEVPDRNPIRRQGEGYKNGKVVLEKNLVIRPYEQGLLIESGNANCSVFKPIRMSVQVTGSEIDKDKDSNGPVLQSLISRWPGVTVQRWPVLKDDPHETAKRMNELQESSDLVITTGGISAGRHDYILRAMQDLGADILIRKVKQKPGKPFTVTRLNGVPFFHLPGNPVSAVFTAEFYVRQVILKNLELQFPALKAFTTRVIQNHRKEKTLFQTGRLKIDDQNRLAVTTEDKMRSHLMQLYKGNNTYVKLDPATEYQKGDEVEVIPFSSFQPGIKF